MIDHVFVYGTLKTGQCRQSCWPLKPTRICPAWTNGELIDLGAYPGLLAGDQRVLGEVWSFPMDGLPLVLQVLDRIEGTNQAAEENEYDRKEIEVCLDLRASASVLSQSLHTQTPHTRRAYAYFYARRELAQNLPRMSATQAPDGQYYVSWPAQAPLRINPEIPNIA